MNILKNIIIKNIKLVTTTLLLIATTTLTYPQPPNISAKNIMLKSQNSSKISGSESIVTLTIFSKKGDKRIRKFTSATKTYKTKDKTNKNGNIEKRIMRFLSPPEVKGTTILTFDNEKKIDDMWIYMPALRKTRRIVSNDKGKSFMGSEFSNADITMPNIDNYKYKILDSEKIDNVECWNIESIPLNDDIADEDGYSKKIVWVGKKDFVTRKGVYYDYDGELFKELTAKNIKCIEPKNKKFQATEITMKNIQNNRKSIMSIEKIIFNPSVKDEYFTTRYLEK